MNYSQTKICKGKCHKPFRPLFEGQTICSQCSILPHKKMILDIDELRKNIPSPETNNQNYNNVKKEDCTMPKEKICVDCQKPYIATGNCQKRCSECNLKKKTIKKPDKIVIPMDEGIPAESVYLKNPSFKKPCESDKKINITILVGNIEIIINKI
jgi:hypothetical protein